MITTDCCCMEIFTKSHNQMLSIQLQPPEQCFSQDQMVVSFHTTATPTHILTLIKHYTATSRCLRPGRKLKSTELGNINYLKAAAADILLTDVMSPLISALLGVIVYTQATHDMKRESPQKTT